MAGPHSTSDFRGLGPSKTNITSEISSLPLVLSITEIENTLGLDPVVLDIEVEGGTPPYTFSWKVNNATIGIDDPTLSSTTFTPTAQGQHAAECIVTDSNLVSSTEVELWSVGEVPSWSWPDAPTDQTDLSAQSITVRVTGAIGGILTLRALHNGIDVASNVLSASSIAISTSPQDFTVTITPSALSSYTIGGGFTLAPFVEVNGVIYHGPSKSMAAGTVVHGYQILINADFRENVAIPGNGTYTIGGVPVVINGSAGLTTKEATEANGIYLLRNGTGTGAYATIYLADALAAVGHTWNPAAWEYLFAVDCERGAGGGECVQAIGDSLENERMLLGQRNSGYMWMFQRGNNAWDTWPGTIGRAMVWIMKGHVYDIRHGSVTDITAWKGETTELVRFGGTGKEERSFENTNQVPGTTAVTNTGTAPRLEQQPRAANSWIKWRRFIVAIRPRP